MDNILQEQNKVIIRLGGFSSYDEPSWHPFCNYGENDEETFYHLEYSIPTTVYYMFVGMLLASLHTDVQALMVEVS